MDVIISTYHSTCRYRSGRRSALVDCIILRNNNGMSMTQHLLLHHKGTTKHFITNKNTVSCLWLCGPGEAHVMRTPQTLYQ